MRPPLAITQYGICLGGVSSQQVYVEARRAQEAWERHLDAGRIGVREGLSAEQRARLAHNERILAGRVVTPELR